MAIRYCCFVLVFLCPLGAFAQTASSSEEPVMTSLVPATPAEARLAGFDQKKRLEAASLVTNVALNNIGPTVMSGRVVDVDVNPDDPTQFYVAYASGGLWKTTNNGLSFESVFDDQPSMTLGDIAVDWARGETIWVGTGENKRASACLYTSAWAKRTSGPAKK